MKLPPSSRYIPRMKILVKISSKSFFSAVDRFISEVCDFSGPSGPGLATKSSFELRHATDQFIIKSNELESLKPQAQEFKLDSKLYRSPDLTPDVPRVEETHKPHT